MQKIIKKEKDSIKLSIDSKIYPLSTVYSAGYVFLDRAYIYLDREDKDRMLINLFPKDKKEDLDQLGMEFYNELLNYAHYFTSLKANADTLKTLMQRALFSVSPSLVQESEEKEIQDLIKELEEEEVKEAKVSKTKKKK